jgi:F0F1-type ATP synthase delta subunit
VLQVDFTWVADLANSEATFAVLFILGLYFIGKWFMNYMAEQKEENRMREEQLIDNYKEQLAQSNQREVRLITHLEKNTEQLKHIANTLDGVEQRLTTFEVKINNDLHNVWKELGGKQDKN